MKKNLLVRFSASLVFMFFVLPVLVLFSHPSSAYATPPNIIIIEADNMGWGDLCNMASFETPTNLYLCGAGDVTANLTSLANGGVTMTNFHAATPSCSPSRASLLTGMSSRRHGVSNKGLYLSPSFQTIANMLQGSYDTGIVGKWHLGDSEAGVPGNRGFNYYYITPTGVLPGMSTLCFVEGTNTEIISRALYTTHDFMPADVDDLCKNVTPSSFWTLLSQPTISTLPSYLTDKAVSFINRGHGGKPFFLYLTYTTPHGPLDVDIPYGSLVSENTRTTCGLANTTLEAHCGQNQQCKDDTIACYTDNQFATTKPYYRQAIKQIDSGVQRIMNLSAVDDNTIVIFLSDNGAWMGASLEYYNKTNMNRNSTGGLRGGYPFLYEGGSRVPLIVRWPTGGWGADHKASETVFSGQLSDITDILPTVLNAAQSAGAQVKLPNTPIDGVDIGPVLKGTTPSLKKDVQYYHFDARRYYTTPDNSYVDAFPYAVQSYDPVDSTLNFYKLFLSYDYSPREFYDLHDQRELAQATPDPGRISTLTGKSKEFMDSIGSATQFYFPLNAFFNSLNGDMATSKLFVQARDLRDFINVKIQFYDMSGSLAGFMSLGLKENTFMIDTLLDLCKNNKSIFKEPVPSCSTDHFEGSVAVFTDKPAFVNLIMNRDNKLLVLEPASLSTKHVFPKVYDNKSTQGNLYTNNLILWSPLATNVTVSCVPTSSSCDTKSLVPYKKMELRPSALGISSGMISVESSTIPFAAIMQYDISNSNAAAYLSPENQHELYFPWIKDGDKRKNWLTIENDLNYDRSVYVRLYSPTGQLVTQSTVTVPANYKYTLSPVSLLTTTSFEGSIAVVSRDTNTFRALTDSIVSTSSCTTCPSNPILGYDIYRAIMPSSALAFPNVVDESGTAAGRHSSLYVLNTGATTTIEVSMTAGTLDTVDCCARFYNVLSQPTVTTLYNIPPMGRIVIRPSEEMDGNFTGTIRVKTDTDSPLTGVVYSEITDGSTPSAMNIHEAIPINPGMALNHIYPICGTGPIKLPVLKNDVNGQVSTDAHIIHSYLDTDAPLGTVINRGSYIEYWPEDAQGTDVFHYTIGTDEGIESTATVTVVPCDATPPVVGSFSIPATSSSLVVPITAFTATDNNGVTGYMATESSTEPLPAAVGWTTTAPTSYTFANAGIKTLYAWAKDAAGNVSSSLSAGTTIDNTLPIVQSFSIPATSSSLVVPITAFTATDNNGVTGYMATESSTKPLPAAVGWTTIAPTSYTFANAGAKTLYAWAKDAAGNVSSSLSANTTITIAAPSVSPLNAWSNIHSSATQTSAIVAAGSFTVGSGSNRLLLVSVVMELAAASSPTITAIYSGTTLSQVKVSNSSPMKEIVWIGSLKESQIAGNGALTITYSGTAPSNVSALHVKWAAFSGVNQTVPFASVGGTSTTTTSATFGSTITYKTNGMTTIVSGNGGSSANGAITVSPTGAPPFTAGTATKNNPGQSSNTFTTALPHTTNNSYGSGTKVTWSGTTSKWSGLVVVSMQP